MTMPTSGLVVSGVGLVIVYHWLEKKKAGRKHIPPGLLDRNYFESPIVLGAGAGWALLAQAPRPRAKAAKATAAMNLANVMVGFFSSFLGVLPAGNLPYSIMLTILFGVGFDPISGARALTAWQVADRPTGFS